MGPPDRDGLLAAAVRLLTTNPGASTEEIARAAGVSRATLHRIYPSRQALTEALAERALAATREAIESADLDSHSPFDGLAKLVEVLLPIAHQYAFLMNEAQLEQSSRLVEAVREFDERLESFFLRGQAAGEFRVDQPASWLALLLTYTLLAASEGVRVGIIGYREAPRIVSESLLSGLSTRRSESP